MCETLIAGWDDLKMQSEEVIDFGDRLLGVSHVTGHGRLSGIVLDIHLFHVVNLRRGAIVRQRERRLSRAAGRPQSRRAVGVTRNGERAEHTCRRRGPRGRRAPDSYPQRTQHGYLATCTGRLASLLMAAPPAFGLRAPPPTSPPHCELLAGELGAAPNATGSCIASVSNDVAEVTVVSSLGSARAPTNSARGGSSRPRCRAPSGRRLDDDDKADASGEDQTERQSLRFLVHEDQNATGRQEVRGDLRKLPKTLQKLVPERTIIGWRERRIIPRLTSL